MPAACESSVGDGIICMSSCSHIANYPSSPSVRKFGNEIDRQISFNANMAKTEHQNINAGPNYLAEWIEYRLLTQALVADRMGISKAMMSDLVNGKRALTAAYMQRLAQILQCRPGDLIDFHPHDVPPELRDVMRKATPEERAKIAAVAETMLRYAAGPKMKPGS